jgi:hypothetical protein
MPEARSLSSSARQTGVWSLEPQYAQRACCAWRHPYRAPAVKSRARRELPAVSSILAIAIVLFLLHAERLSVPHAKHAVTRLPRKP